MKYEMTVKAINDRYDEFMMLRSLPLLCGEQAVRFHALKKQRAKDNIWSMKQRQKEVYEGLNNHFSS